MGDMAEDRVYRDDAGTTEVVVAAGIGVVSVSVANGRIGRFGVSHRCTPRDIAAAPALLAVATDENVLLRQEGAFVPSGFGPAVAVGIREGAVLAATADGRIARLADGEGAWTDLGTVDAEVHAMDGALLATDAGVYRLRSDGDRVTIRSAGLAAANDVASRGPFAATDTGLYVLKNGWMQAMESRFTAVAAASRERAYAVSRATEATCGTAVQEYAEGDWRTIDTPADGPVADVALAESAYAITESGTLLVAPEWRSRSLGVDGVVGIAVT